MNVGDDQQVIGEMLGEIPKEDMTLDVALNHFETVYMASRNYAAKTRVDYRNDVTDLIKFLQRSGSKSPRPSA